MARLLVGFVALVAAVLCWPAAARADVGVYPLMKVVPVGGVIVGWGDGSGLAVYLVPARLGPRRHRCHGNAICEPTSPHPPGRPFRFLGRLRRTTSLYARQSFSFPVPAGLSPGAYRMYLYCPRCGGSLIQSGQRLEGETIRLTARPRSRLIQVGAGAARDRFLLSEPTGVILLLRLTVAHGMHAAVSGTIPALAGVAISTDAGCRRRGPVDVCTQREEWCPMPAAAWHFRLHKLSGPGGSIRLDFVIGKPPHG